MKVEIMSFSFGGGIPKGASMVFNARFLKPPAQEKELVLKTGLDEIVGDFIESDPDFTTFLEYLVEIVSIFLPRYYARYKDTVVVAIGCTGGQHRSVYTAERLGKKLQKLKYAVTVTHRDIPNESNQGQLLHV